MCAAGAECTSMWIDWSRLFLGCGTPNKIVAKHWLNGIGFDMTKAFLLRHAVKRRDDIPHSMSLRSLRSGWQACLQLFMSTRLCQRYFLSLVIDLTGLLVEIGN